MWSRARGRFMDQWRVEVLLNATAFVVMTLIVIASFVLTKPVKTEAPKTKEKSKLPAFFDRTIFSWLSAGILVQAGGFGLVSCFVLYISEISQSPIHRYLQQA